MYCYTDLAPVSNHFAYDRIYLNVLSSFFEAVKVKSATCGWLGVAEGFVAAREPRWMYKKASKRFFKPRVSELPSCPVTFSRRSCCHRSSGELLSEIHELKRVQGIFSH